jgi:hypothetical protein
VKTKAGDCRSLGAIVLKGSGIAGCHNILIDVNIGRDSSPQPGLSKKLALEMFGFGVEKVVAKVRTV